MSEKDKQEDGKGLPKGSSGTPESGAGKEEKPAVPGQAATSGKDERPAAAGTPASASGEAADPAAVAAAQSIDDFADSVASGLEQAGLASPGKEDLDLHRFDLEHMSEVFFAGWEAQTKNVPQPIHRRPQIRAPFPK